MLAFFGGTFNQMSFALHHHQVLMIHVSFPSPGYDYSVLVTSRAHLNSLEFPSTGELMFGDRASITFSLSGLGPGQCCK